MSQETTKLPTMAILVAVGEAKKYNERTNEPAVVFAAGFQPGSESTRQLFSWLDWDEFKARGVSFNRIHWTSERGFVTF